ncbi:MAG: DUF808 domain-containing protein [Thiovulaceae bacterium]|nr:DUF808 domain-containing protein [Sulfurimonadaceae bacterium]
MTGGLFAILDDIAMLLDDTAAMSKVAAKKTAGVLGDDLAVGAEKASGFHASRELPVLWAITKGSFLNKIIILPLAFLLSAFLPSLIVPILLLGGIYLSYEGVEKIYEVFFHKESHSHPVAAQSNDKQTILEAEIQKIKSAIRTDFILSIEIIIIALGTVITQPLMIQVIVVSLIAILATVGVYGLVALLVRMDDMGFYLIKRAEHKAKTLAIVLRRSGELLVAGLPKIIRLLGIVGTIAMLLVGGGMFVHNIPLVHELLHFLPMLLAEFLMGLLVGSFALAAKSLIPVNASSTS